MYILWDWKHEWKYKTLWGLKRKLMRLAEGISKNQTHVMQLKATNCIGGTYFISVELWKDETGNEFGWRTEHDIPTINR